jgi:hypothetical protein
MDNNFGLAHADISNRHNLQLAGTFPRDGTLNVNLRALAPPRTKVLRIRCQFRRDKLRGFCLCWFSLWTRTAARAHGAREMSIINGIIIYLDDIL